MLGVSNNERLNLGDSHVQLVDLMSVHAVIAGPFTRSERELAWLLRSALG